MEITEVRIKLMEDNSGSNERLQAFCSITFDDMFVIRDLKIIEGAKGFFVAMPSRKLTDRCHNCGTKNHLRSRFCNQCGCRLDENRAIRDADGRAKLHADIAHPINSMCREKIQAAVLASYAEELERSKMPGYVSRYDDYEADDSTCRTRRTPPAGRSRTASEPPLRRGPLRGHTQHARGNQSVLRGPHVPPRKESSAEGIGSDRDAVGRVRQRPLSGRGPRPAEVAGAGSPGASGPVPPGPPPHVIADAIHGHRLRPTARSPRRLDLDDHGAARAVVGVCPLTSGVSRWRSICVSWNPRKGVRDPDTPPTRGRIARRVVGSCGAVVPRPDHLRGDCRRALLPPGPRRSSPARRPRASPPRWSSPGRTSSSSP